MIRHQDITDAELRKQIRQGRILAGGNSRLKIYGNLGCSSGKKMKRENRIFFRSAEEAIESGFSPCGHCLKGAYKKWKQAPKTDPQNC
ncbi:MAG: Ada metal-binding domain-containing protein [Chitinophagaceae bacterium]